MSKDQQLTLFDGGDSDFRLKPEATGIPQPEATGSVEPAAAPSEGLVASGFSRKSDPPSPDQGARDFAVDPRNNVVLEASAGTGKTSVLVSR
ncbi:MAG TPA: hypothetical protein VF147_02945, partial [Vicinamibacterales bacterium]